MRSVLVTGGAGFIGSHFVDYLLANYPEKRVIVLDKLTYAGNTAHLDEAKRLAGNRLRFVQGDVANLALDTWLLEEEHCEAIIHFAGESHVVRSTQDPLLFLRHNNDGTVVLLEAARCAHIQRFLLISSVEVYGSCGPQEDAWRETAMAQATTPYAASKIAAEIWASAYWRTYGLPVVITRSCNNYGPRQHVEKQLPDLISMAWRGEALRLQGDGKHLRQWLYVEDHCRALDLLLHAEASEVAGEIFNIGSGPGGERTTLQNARAVLEQMGLSRKIVFGPDRQPSIRRLAVDSTKLEQRLGWKPQVSFDEGLARTLAYYQELLRGTLRPGVRLAEPALAQV
jgi:dTDP-glucose 4,6-dehydratase